MIREATLEGFLTLQEFDNHPSKKPCDIRCRAFLMEKAQNTEGVSDVLVMLKSFINTHLQNFDKREMNFFLLKIIKGSITFTANSICVFG